MVAIFTGAGTGIERSSARLLGGSGLLGSATLGRSGEQAYVNAATGNLMLTTVDEMLLGRGPDAVNSRTYNSFGGWDGDNDDNWRASGYRRVFGLAGGTGYGTVGSTVKRTDWDGSEVTYSWDAASSAYVATDGAGAYNTLTRTGTDWKWVDGDTQIQELYDDSNGGRIKSQSDTSGNNSVTYGYTGTLLTQITTADGGYTLLKYGGTGGLQLQSLETHSTSPTATSTRVFYSYDANDRLTKVQVNLSPADNSTAVTAGLPTTYNYETSYTYDGTSQRVASITQSDGTLVAFEYTQYGADYRISKITETISGVSPTVTRVTTISYDTTNRITTVTDALGQVTKLGYDVAGNLLSLTLPPPGTGDPAPSASFTYETDGDLATMTSAGNTVAYGYDGHGNRTLERDSLGNTVTRTFSAKNELLTETRYTVPDPDGAGSTLPSGAMTTRYAYDAKSNLRFVVDGEGRVTEYVYNIYNQRTAVIGYATNLYPGTPDLETWAAGIADKSTTQRTETSYDFRGNISEVNSYATLKPTGEFNPASEHSRTVYIYNGHGELVSRIVDGTGMTETFAYDGLGRLLSTSENGTIKTSAGFSDTVNGSTTTIALANGLVRTSTYDRAGNLILYAESGTGIDIPVTTSYKYDALGRLRMATDPNNQRDFFLYDADGRKIAAVDSDGTVTEFRYDAAGRVTSTTAYATRLTDAQLTLLAAGNGNPSDDGFPAIRPAPSADDRWGWTFYDLVGRMIRTIDGTGAVTVYAYDGASQLTSTTELATRMSAAGVAALKAQTARANLYPDSNGPSQWQLIQSSMTASGTIDGGNANRLSVNTTGTSGIARSNILAPVAAGETIALTMQFKADTINYVTFGPQGTLDTWGNAGESTATISGPGTLTRISGGLWAVTGLSQTDVTTVTITRTFTRAQSVYGLLYIGTHNGPATANDAIIVANPALIRAVPPPVNIYTNPNDPSQWQMLQSSLTASGTINGANANRLSVNTTGTSGIARSNILAPVATGDTLALTVQFKADTINYVTFGQQGTLDTWGNAGESTATISGPGALTRISGGLWAVTGLSQTDVTTVTITRTFTRAQSVYGFLYIGTHSGPATANDAIIVVNPTLARPINSLPALPAVDAVNDRASRLFYDNAGRLIGSLDAEGYVSKIVYDNAGRKIETIARKTKPSTTTGDFAAIFASATADNAADIHNFWLYDARGLMRASIDGEGDLARYRYTPGGLVDQVITGQRVTPNTAYTLAGLPANATDTLDTLTSTYNAFGQVLTETRTLASGTETTTYSYDVMRQLVSKTTASNVAADKRTSSWRYDTRGRLTGELSGEGSVALAALGATPTQAAIDDIYARYGTRYVYDAGDRLIARIDPDGTTGGLKTLFYYDAGDRLAHQINAAGEVVSYIYNSFGQVADTIARSTRVNATTLATMAGGAITAAVITAIVVDSDPSGDGQADSHSLLYYNVDGTVGRTRDALGSETRFDYNAFRQWVTRTEALTGPPATLTERTTTRVYDQRGLMEAETLDTVGANALALPTGYTYDAFGRLTKVIDPALHATQTFYDRAGRVTKVTDALLQDTTYSYDGRGNVAKITDRNGKDTVFTYSAFNRTVTMTTPEGLITTTQVNAYGQKISVQDPGGRTLSWTYDRDGSLDIARDASNTIITDNQYDIAGRLFQTKDARGVVTQYGYDAANRVMTRTVDASGLNLVTTYAYDAKGQQVQVTEATGKPEERSTRIDYDLNGRKLAVVVDPGAGKLNLRTDYTYDAAGRLLSTAEGTGTVALSSATAARFTAYSYDDADRVVQTTVDPTGLNLRTGFTYDKAGNLVARTDGLGTGDARITRFRYDANDRLTHTVDALGQVTGSVYDNEGRVIETRAYWNIMPLTGSTPLDLSQAGAPAIPATNANDRVMRYVYDTDGRLAFSIDTLGQITGTSYDGSGNVTARTTYAVPLGGTAVTLAALKAFALVTANNAGARVTRMAYDSAGRLAYSVDAQGAASKFVYDLGGNLLNRTDFATAYTGTGPLVMAAMDTFANANTIDNRITRMAYDAAGRMVASVDANGSATRITYDALGNVLKQTAYALPASTTVQPTATTTFAINGDDRTTQYIYDDAGRVTYHLDALNYLIKYDYNALDQVIAETRYANALAVSGDFDAADLAALTTSTVDDRTTGYEYDKAGRIAVVTDGEGFKTKTLYDALGRVTDIKYAFGQSTDESTTHRVYDAVDRLVDEIIGYNTPEASKTHYVYDTLGQVTDITRGDVALSAAQSSTTHRTYDAMGRLATETRGFGTPQAATTGYGYDTLGRLTLETDPLNHVTVRGYDLMNRVTSISVPVDATPANNLVTLKQYNRFGDLEMITDPALNKGYFYYDKLGRVTLQVDAELYANATNYTAFGQVKDVTRYETPLAGAPTAGVKPAMPAPNPNMGYSLGDATTRFIYDKLGQVTASTNALNQTESTSYNAFGERKQVANRLDGVGGVNGKTDYTYDRRGLLKTETLPVTSKNAGGTSIAVVNSFSYDARGNRTGMVEAVGLPEQRTTAYQYDKLDRLTETRLIEDRPGKSFTVLVDGLNGIAPTTSTQLLVQTTSYDARGNIIRTTDGAGSKTTFYFDALDRQVDLISATGTLSHWDYDKNGNILASRVYGTTIAVPSTPGATAPAATSPTQYRQTTFTYDFANRQTGTASLAFRTGAYDSVSSSYVISDTAVTTQTEYDKLGNIVRQQDGNGNWSYSFYDKLGRRVAQVDPEKYLTSWVLDSDGNATTETRFAKALTGAVTTASTLAAMISDAGAANADNRITTFEYNINGQRIKQTRKNVVAWTVNMSNVIAGASDATIVYSYNGLGQVTQKIEANYDVTDYQYDGTGRLTQEAGATFTDYDGGPAVRRATSYSYDGLNNLTGTVMGALGVVDVANDRTTSYTYDSAGRVATMTNAAGLTRTYLYDAAGRVTRESYTRLNSADANTYEGIGYRYDAEGRLTAQAAGSRANGTDLFTFNGANGGTKHMRYNAFGEMSGRGLTGMPSEVPVYQETFEYDNGGRLWRSNAGDGVYRIYLYDKAGNQTLSLVSSTISLSGVADAGTIAANGTSSIAGSVTTLTLYDKRGMTTATREPQRVVAAGATPTDITRSRTYNAFGEVLSETDARLQTNEFKYNSLGRMIEKKAPNVSVTGTNGIATTVRPTERYYYDISGRLVGVKDANQVQVDDATASTADDLQHISTRVLLAGTGHGDDEAMTVQENHLDGAIVSTAYDVYGNVRKVTDEIARVTSMGYDKGGRLISVAHFGGLTDNYTYDGLGQRLTHWNSFLGSGNREKTDYDASGRVIAVAAFGDEAVTTSYIWDLNLATNGLGTFGGWSLLTLNHGAGLRETSDYFDHLATKTDMEGRVTNIGYDLAGRVLTRTITEYNASAPTPADSLTYSYFNTGLAASATSGTFGTATSYGYDAAGHKLTEYATIAGTVTQDATATYDELGRIKTWSEAGNSKLPASTLAWAYDAVGNIRSENAGYRPIADNGTPSATTTKGQSFSYDVMNRVIGVTGDYSATTITYNAAGQRMTATDSSLIPALQSYSYDAAGNLEHVKLAQGTFVDTGGGNYAWVYGPGEEKATFTYDGMNRLKRQQDWLGNGSEIAYDREVTYNSRGQVYYEKVSQQQGADFFVSTTTTIFEEGTTYYLGAPLRTETATIRNGTALPTSSTLYNYSMYEGAVQKLVYYSPDKNRAEYYTTEYAYSGAGVFKSAHVADGRTRDVTVTSDVLGQAIARDETGSDAPHEVWYRFNGMELGHVTNNGTGATDYQTSIDSRVRAQGTGGAFKGGWATGISEALFGDGYTPITSYAQGAGGGSYTVRAGDTLSSIAAQVWGDANLWYKLGQANGLGQGSALTEGMVITIPAGVTKSSNSASTFKPYDPSDAFGDTSPTTPKPQNPKKNKCGIFGQILLVAVAVAVSVWLGPEIVGFAQGLLGGTVSGAIIGGAVTGALASVASQAVGIVTGIQQGGFNWKGVALGALAGAVGGGVSQIPGIDGIVKGVGTVADKATTGLRAVTSAIGRAAIGNVITQGIATATGLQNKFDWAGVATSAISAGFGEFIGGQLRLDGSKSIGNTLKIGIAGAAGAIAGAATRSAIEGSSFGDNIIAALPDAIGQTIGNLVAKGIGTAFDGKSGKEMRAELKLRTDAQKALAGDPDYQEETAGTQNVMTNALVMRAQQAGASPSEILADPRERAALDNLMGISGRGDHDRVAAAESYMRDGLNLSDKEISDARNLAAKNFPNISRPPEILNPDGIFNDNDVKVTATYRDSGVIAGVLERAGHFFNDNADNPWAKGAVLIVSALTAPVTTGVFLAASYTPGVSDVLEQVTGYVGKQAITYGAKIAVAAGVEEDAAPWVALGAFGIVGTAALGVSALKIIPTFLPIARQIAASARPGIAAASLALGRPTVASAFERGLLPAGIKAAESTAPTRGVFIGSMKGATPAERAFAKELVAQGRRVEMIPRASTKTPDFLVDGVRTELKSIQGNGKNTLKNAIQEASKQGEQILIDARNVNVTQQFARAQIARAINQVGKLNGRVTILTPDGTVKY